MKESGQQGDTAVVVAQLGARHHYAIPILLARRGMLERFYTDLWADKGMLGRLACVLSPWLPLTGLRQWAGRRDGRLPGDKVIAFTRFGLEYVRRVRTARTPAEMARNSLWAGEAFGRLVAQHGFGNSRAIYGFLGESRGLFERAREAGLRTILDHMACPQLYRRLEKEEHERWPGWENETADNHLADALAEREAAERELADVVLCPSEFVEHYARSRGTGAEKLRRVPYGVEVEKFRVPAPPYRGDRPLRVLFAGGVRLMKGVPYLLEAVRSMKSSQLEVRLAGRVLLTPKARAEMPAGCRIVGLVARSEMVGLYTWCDVVVQPSLCEGSSMVTYEALAAGRAVIATTNAGSPVRDGEDGFLVPIRDAAAIAQRLDRLAGRPDLLEEMKARAREREKDLSWQAYGQRLCRVVLDLCGEKQNAAAEGTGA